jgi:hypothetical protein
MGAILCLYFVLFFSVWTYGAVMPKQLLASEIVGIIAGDDTIMLAIRTKEDTKIVMSNIRKVLMS